MSSVEQIRGKPCYRKKAEKLVQSYPQLEPVKGGLVLLPSSKDGLQICIHG